MTEQDIIRRLHAAQTLARDGGQLALRHFRDHENLKVRSKGVQNITSQTDEAVEALIRGRLEALFPEDGFFGEETGAANSGDDGRGIWVVDPIDGTDCFVNGIPVWSVSVAFVLGREIEIGVVYDPNAEEMFVVQRGHGARVNGRPVKPSSATSFRDGVFCVGYSTRREPGPTLDVLGRLLRDGGMFQRNGSAALALAYIASGRYIGYFEYHINSWDCLAGLALIREAGGWTSDFLDGDGLRQGNPLAASAPGLAPAMKELTGLD